MFKEKQNKKHVSSEGEKSHFQVDFENTERLKKSAIPSMQRILNKDYSDNQARRVRNPG